jgi:hypothetical protein
MSSSAHRGKGGGSTHGCNSHGDHDEDDYNKGNGGLLALAAEEVEAEVKVEVGDA